MCMKVRMRNGSARIFLVVNPCDESFKKTFKIKVLESLGCCIATVTNGA